MLMFLNSGAQAQNADSLTINELGISFSGLHQYGLLFRHGHKNALWRLNVLYLDGTSLKNDLPQAVSRDHNFQDSKNEWSFGARALVGREFRKYIKPSLAVKCGIDASVYYGHLLMEQKTAQSSSSDNVTDNSYAIQQQAFSSTTVNCSFNPILGMMYEVARWNFSVELLPGISYSVTKINDSENRELHYFDQTQIKTLTTDDKYTVKRLQYGLQSSSAIFSIAYRL